MAPVSTKAPLSILLVEDNPVNQLMAQGTLSYLGHQVVIASGGEQAVQAFDSHSFDLVLMDLMMPGMDGYQASSAILERCQSLGQTPPAIVALTSTIDETVEGRCLEHGMTRWLSKPISPEEFQKIAASMASPPISADSLLSRVKDPEAVAKIVELFGESYPLRLRELEQSLAREDANPGKLAVHTLRGNFLNFGAAAAAETTQSLTAALEESRWEDARRRLPHLRAQCEAVENALRELIETPAEGAHSSQEDKGVKVIVADTDPANRALCSAALQEEGYMVMEAADGDGVLELLRSNSIDVVLMGVAGLDGFGTCRRIKADPKTGMIPVLLLTALEEKEARLTGMGAGADDFLSKPIDPDEVSLRVRNAARGKALYDQLQESFQELKQLEQLRDGLTHMLVHDMRTPLAAIKGYASLLTTRFGAGLTDHQKSFAEKMMAQSNRLVEMVSAILDVSRLESNQLPLRLAKVDLSLLLLTTSDQLAGLPGNTLQSDLADAVYGWCDEELIGRVVINLLANAFHYTPEGQPVKLSLSARNGVATVSVVDKGPGVPPASRQRIFEKFTRVEGETHHRPYSSGLGLTFCQLVVHKHGGEIGVSEGEEGKGSRFWFTLPLEANRVPPG